MFAYRFYVPAIRSTLTCDSGAETPEAALKDLRRFLGRRVRQRRRDGLPAYRLPVSVYDLIDRRVWPERTAEPSAPPAA